MPGKCSGADQRVSIGRASGRHLVDHRNVQIAIERQRERARNRRGGHDQHVGRAAFFDQPFALQHAEAVLLVHDHQAQARECDRIFEQRVRPDDQLRFARAARARRCRAWQRASGRSPAAPRDSRPARTRACADKIMLHGENFRRRHQRHLLTVFDHDGGRLERHDGFPAADVALQQAVHRLGAFEIGGDFRQHSLLRRGGLEGKNALERFSYARLAHAKSDAGLLLGLAAAAMPGLTDKKKIPRK